MAAQGQAPDNGRITMAILGERLANLQATVERNHREICLEVQEARDEIKALEERRTKTTDDHEARIRGLESRKTVSAWADVGAYVSAIAAAVAGVVIGKP